MTVEGSMFTGMISGFFSEPAPTAHARSALILVTIIISSAIPYCISAPKAHKQSFPTLGDLRVFSSFALRLRINITIIQSFQQTWFGYMFFLHTLLFCQGRTRQNLFTRSFDVAVVLSEN